ncbi:hypothetical protein D3C80_2086070 [compost metagenome]
MARYGLASAPGRRFSTRRAAGPLAGMRRPAARLSYDQQALFGEAKGLHRRWKEFTFGANSRVKSARQACWPPMK